MRKSLLPRGDAAAAALVATALLGSGLAGCASEGLQSQPPAGVNLSGQWQFDPNLSDDADRLGEKDDVAPLSPPARHGHGGGRNGPGGMGPMGEPPPGGGGGAGLLPLTYTDAPDSASAAMSETRLGAASSPQHGAGDELTAMDMRSGHYLRTVGADQSTPVSPPSTITDSAAAPARADSTSRGATISRYLKAPAVMLIRQNGASVTIRATMSDGTTTQDEFTPGTQNNTPFGKGLTADRTVGWRGPVLVVTVNVKKGGFREDDFAVDDDGHLIMTTFTKGGKVGKVEIKRVFDRVKGS